MLPLTGHCRRLHYEGGYGLRILITLQHDISIQRTQREKAFLCFTLACSHTLRQAQHTRTHSHSHACMHTANTMPGVAHKHQHTKTQTDCRQPGCGLAASLMHGEKAQIPHPAPPHPLNLFILLPLSSPGVLLLHAPTCLAEEEQPAWKERAKPAPVEHGADLASCPGCYSCRWKPALSQRRGSTTEAAGRRPPSPSQLNQTHILQIPFPMLSWRDKQTVHNRFTIGKAYRRSVESVKDEHYSTERSQTTCDHCTPNGIQTER